jgi:tRNA (guanine-N7-)-methyltransferase
MSAVIVALESILEPLCLERLFPIAQPVEIELGAGDGGFLVEYAARTPEHNFIGVERLLGRLRKIERRAGRRGLGNLRAIRLEAAYFLKYLVPGRSIVALHVYFPDPWPKRKHWRNRLVNAEFPVLAQRALAPGGTVYLRTDHAEYFAQMQGVFESHGGFALLETPAPLIQVPTDFERDFVARGTPVFRTAYSLRRQ